MGEEIGELFETPDEAFYEWHISNFMSLPEENSFYLSSKFLFADACWYFKIYPNGYAESMSAEWIGICLCRHDSGPPKDVEFMVGIKKADSGEESILNSGRFTYFKNDSYSFGPHKLLKRSNLLSRKSQLVPSGTLRLKFLFESDGHHSRKVSGSLFNRLLNLSLSLKEMRNIRTDVVLKLKDGKIPAHRMILESRSSVFKRMFDVDMREAQDGEVNIEDGNEDTFKVVLSYVYSGDPEGLCSENACEVYRIAHRYDFQDLQNFCTEFLQECLSVATICDTIMIAHLYEEKKLMEVAKDYFFENKTEIFQTDQWKTLKMENSAVGFEILEYVFGGRGSE